MRKETNLTVGQWCDRWFRENQGRWSGSTVGGYRNLIYRHILPRIGGIPLRSWPKTPSPASMTACGARDSAPEASGASICSCGAVWMKQLVTSESLQSGTTLPGTTSRSVSNNSLAPGTAPAVPERGGNSWAHSLSSTQDSPAACGNVNSSPCRGPIFNIRCRYILKGQRLLTLTAERSICWNGYRKAGCYVFLNPKTGAPYQLHEFYYLHKRILKQAGLPWVAFRNLQRQCMEVGI